MGEAKRRQLIEQRQDLEEPARYSEPWPCPNCSNPDDYDGENDNKIFVVRRGWASCPDCSYSNYRKNFGFATYDQPPT